MNTGTTNTLRYWLSTLVLAAVMATAATTVALNLADSEETAAYHMWYAGHNGSSGSGGG